MTSSLLTVIIPTLDEAENLPALLHDLQQQQEIILEIIVSDGGSADSTCSIAAAASVRVVHSQRGRAVQMSAGAAHASGDYLLFLHADSRLNSPDLLRDALHALRAEVSADQRVAGHFPLKFVRTSARHSMAYRYAEEKSTLNRVNTTNGDQGFLLSRAFFNELGGFDEGLPFLEDQRLAEKIRAQGRWITLPGCLHTSARRFEREGFHRRYILMSMMMGFYSIGVTEFFTRGGDLYRVQSETGRLLLSPVFSLIWKLMAEWGVGGSIRNFYRLGRYIRSHSWQLFFFFDLRFRSSPGPGGRYPFLNFHDRFIAHCTDYKFFDAVTGVLTFIWFLGILAPYFFATDYLFRSKGCDKR